MTVNLFGTACSELCVTPQEAFYHRKTTVGYIMINLIVQMGGEEMK